MTDRERNREALGDLLKLRKDRRYRSGLLQGAVTFGVITHAEWVKLQGHVNAGRLDRVFRIVELLEEPTHA